MAKKKRQIAAMSRRLKSAITVTLLLIAFFLALFDQKGFFKTSVGQSSPPSTQFTGSDDYNKYNDKFFTVIKTIDGDTFDIDIPDGGYNHTRIRLWGVDTPETKNSKTGVMYYGPQASEFAKQTLLGKQVKIILSEKKTRDKYGRLLAYAQLPDGRFFNEETLKAGFGYADVRFEHLYSYKYQQLEAAARRGKKGLWANVKFVQLPQWLQHEKPQLLGDN